MLARMDEHLTDKGPHKAGTERLCALTREVKPVGQMIRFVAGPGGEAVPDLKRKLPGRGVWITATRAAVDQALRRKLFGRALKQDIHPQPDLAAHTEALLERSALDALAIAGKAGEVISGFSKVEAALTKGEATAVLHASDAAADGIRKLEAALYRSSGGEAGKISVIRAFSTTQLDLALGRSNVVHAALLAGPAGNTFLARSLRLEQFRTGDMGMPERGGAPQRALKD